MEWLLLFHIQRAENVHVEQKKSRRISIRHDFHIAMYSFRPPE